MDGTTVPRFNKDRFYDPSSIEGRTSERAVSRIGNRYDAVLILANRVRELNTGNAPYVQRVQGNRVTAVQEAEAGELGYELFTKNIRLGSR
jgi:DNA-directed RNA polymerase subunit K/omega